MTAGLIGADQLVALFYHIAAADRTLLLRGLLPGHEIALRIVLATVVFSSLFGSAQHHILSALGTGYSDFFQIRLGIAAFRKARAGQEASMGTIFDHHMASAFLADHVRHLILNLYFLQFLFRIT